jgi:predicted kinase
MATVHMICGRVGSGKTTFGRQLATDRRAVFFCLDEWMATLFTMDAPTPLTLEWMLPRVERAERQIVSTARQVLDCGVEVILELGFFRREQRDRMRAPLAGYDLKTHVMDVPRDVRRERVRERNRGSATFSIEVDDATFDWAESYYEPLGDDER